MSTLDINQLVRDELEQAKKDIPVKKPGDPDTSEFMPYALIFCPRGVLQYNFGFGKGEKETARTIIAGFAKLLDAYLVVAVMDMVKGNIDWSVEPFKSMWEQAGADPRKFHEIVTRWRIKKYGPRLSSMPPEYRTDSLVVIGKGPDVKPFALSVDYTYQGNGVVFSELHDMSDGTMEFTLVPDWWKIERSDHLTASEAKILDQIARELMDAIPPEKGHWRERYTEPHHPVRAQA
jgi:hypothetical protein